MEKKETDQSPKKQDHEDELHAQLEKGDGYEADSVDDLMDQLEGRKKLKPIKK
jgi:hypothetical protein